MSKKTPDYLVLVNGDNRLPEDFEDKIEIISIQNDVGATYKIEKKTYEAFLRFQEDVLKNDGIRTDLVSVYRTLKEQEETFEDYRIRFGLEYAEKYVAKVGHSEHHTGLAIDVGIVHNGKLLSNAKELFTVNHLFEIIHKKLPQYGFILRYPKGKEAFTKIGYEPWHFRYINSPAIAHEITDNGMCFEEYHAGMRG